MARHSRAAERQKGRSDMKKPYFHGEYPTKIRFSYMHQILMQMSGKLHLLTISKSPLRSAYPFPE